jgi:hypothetical protein
MIPHTLFLKTAPRLDAARCLGGFRWLWIPGARNRALSLGNPFRCTLVSYAVPWRLPFGETPACSPSTFPFSWTGYCTPALLPLAWLAERTGSLVIAALHRWGGFGFAPRLHIIHPPHFGRGFGSLHVVARRGRPRFVVALYPGGPPNVHPRITYIRFHSTALL